MNELGGGYILLMIFGGMFSGVLILGALYFLFAFWWMDDKEAHIFKAILAGIGAIGLFISLFIGIRGVERGLREHYNYKVYDIVSLERGSSVSGSFVLGTGNIKEKSYYYFYVETDLGYKLNKLETEYTYIRETDEISPSVYKQKNSGDPCSHYFIYCPFGTIVQQYQA